MSFGRELMLGALEYANAQRKWLLHEELRAHQPVAYWPACNGAIVSGDDPEVFGMVLKNSDWVVSCSGNSDPTVHPAVCADSRAIGRLAADHLMACGLKHFGFFGRGSSQRVSVRRGDGFAERLASRGFDVSVSPALWPQHYAWTTHTHRGPLLAWVQGLPKPVGVLAVDDAAAHDLAALCQDHGIAVPESVAIVGVNNDELLCASAWPALSSVKVDFARIGYLAAERMDMLLSGQRIPEDQRLLEVAPALVVARQSTDVLAVTEPNVGLAIAFIREHACEPCSVDQILKRVPVTRRWLERQFIRHIGRTPQKEIMRVRMETARRLLLLPTLSLDSVAERCGFTAAQHLIRAYRQAYGITPAAFRRGQRRAEA
jgi:LacI family transcriptional regulator